MTLSEVQARVAAMNSSVQSMQVEVQNAVMLTAEIWRTTAGVFVFLMQCPQPIHHPLLSVRLPSVQLGFSLLEAGTVRFKNTRNIMIKNVRDTCVSAITRSTQSIHPLLSVRLPSPSLQLGFSLLEAGTVRFKNTRNIMIKNVLDTCVCAIAFWLLGYGIGFGEGSKLLLNAGPHRTSPSRTHLLQVFIAAGTITLWVRFYGFNEGSLLPSPTAVRPCLVVFLPPLSPPPPPTGVHSSGHHHPVFIAAGTIILWVGFYGFNGGSVSLVGQPPLQWVQEVARVCVNTTISASFSGVTVWTLTYRRREPVPEDTFNGVIGGLVAACATSSVVEPYAAAIIGVVAGLMKGGGEGLSLACVAAWTISSAASPPPPTPLSPSLSSPQVGLDVAFHGGEDEGEEFDMEDSQYGGRRFLSGRSMHHRMPGVLETIVRMLNPKRWGRPGGPAEAFGQKRDVWHRALDNTPYGQFSLAMYEANYVMEDTAEVEGSSSGVYIGVHDGHGGTETSEFLKENLYFNLKAQFMHQGGQVSAEAVRGAFHETETAFTQVPHFTPRYRISHPARVLLWLSWMVPSFEASPHLATVGSCSVVAVVTGNALWVANVGDCRAVLGQVRCEGRWDVGQVGRGGGGTWGRWGVGRVNSGSSSRTLHLHLPPSPPSKLFFHPMPPPPSLLRLPPGAQGRRQLTGVSRPTAVRKGDDNSLECRALQLSVDHNLSFASIREKFIEEHADMPDAVVEKRGGFRVKGKVTVTRSFGDLYLKSHEFNREPLFSRFRVPEPFHPPLLSCEPNIAVRLLSPHDSFVILASDGLFEFISNQEAVDIVASSPRKEPRGCGYCCLQRPEGELLVVAAAVVECGAERCRWAEIAPALAPPLHRRHPCLWPCSPLSPLSPPPLSPLSPLSPPPLSPLSPLSPPPLSPLSPLSPPPLSPLSPLSPPPLSPLMTFLPPRRSLPPPLSALHAPPSFQDIARQLIRAALRRAAERREIRYQDLLRMASGQRREYHDDITVVVFFFNHEARNKHATKSNMTWNHVSAVMR
ncbi:unnamed protein product [Closterium sp. NIES-53]